MAILSIRNQRSLSTVMCQMFHEISQAAITTFCFLVFCCLGIVANSDPNSCMDVRLSLISNQHNTMQHNTFTGQHKQLEGQFFFCIHRRMASVHHGVLSLDAIDQPKDNGITKKYKYTNTLPVGGGGGNESQKHRSCNQALTKAMDSKVFCEVAFLLFPFFLLSCVGKVALIVC